MQVININNNTYYLCTDLFENFKDLFSNCKGRDVIKKKKLKDSDYIYAYHTKTGWKVSVEEYSKAKVLISTKWKELNVIEQSITKNQPEITNTSASSFDVSTELVSYSMSSNDNYPIAPDILDIDEQDLQRPKFNINIFLLRLKFKS